MLVENEVQFLKYGGMTPAFVESVWKKRRKAEALRAKQEKERAEEERLQRLKDASRKWRDPDAVVAGDPSLTKAIQIAKAYANDHGYPWGVMVGKSRSKPAAVVRHGAMLAVKRATGMSSVQIGKIFCRDHSSVLHGLKCAAEREARDRGE